MAQAKPDINDVFASSGDILALTPAEIATGWIQEIPDSRVENFLQNRQDAFNKHINEQGIAEWDAVTSYETSAVVKGSDGEIYTALRANISKDPVSSPNDWRYLLSSTPQNLIVNTNGDDSAGIEIGTVGADFALVDYHSNGDSSNDYDVRTSSSGGQDGQNGKGNYSIEADTAKVNGEEIIRDVNTSLTSASGFEVKSNGVIRQYLRTPQIPSNTSVTLSLPTPFIVEGRTIQCTISEQLTNTRSGWINATFNGSKTQVTISNATDLDLVVYVNMEGE